MFMSKNLSYLRIFFKTIFPHSKLKYLLGRFFISILLFQSRGSADSQKRECEQLRAKLLAAETLCEELMDENEDMKKELRDLEEEIEEMQDNFR